MQRESTAFGCARRLGAGVLLLLAGGCAIAPTEKRHSPEEIARYSSADFAAPIASEAGEREVFDEAGRTIRDALALGTADDAEARIPDALSAVAFFNRDLEAGRVILLNALPGLAARPPAYQRGVLSVAHQLYFRDAAPWMRSLLSEIATPREFAIAAYTLLRAEDDAATRAFIRDRMVMRFADPATEPRLVALQDRLATDPRTHAARRPPLAELFAAPLRAGHPVIFSVQRPGRNVFGLALVRGADGRFARDADGSLFAQPMLARATTELPGTITNGHTPRGVFTIVGAGTATNKWIGPTPYLHSKIPVEATVAEYEHAEVQAEWDEARYASFLPPSWRDYFPMKEAWLAGRAGRDDMILHGTTINSGYYTGASYYPGTPSAGCLVSMETWSKADGRQMSSDQLTLAKVFTREGKDRGYLVVVEIDEGPGPVRLDEVVPYLPRE
ncbi:MAG: hypothetical protein JNK75_03255 [Betaproteobacteria bacterium]|nr:hypothetical protein [Betaproteobacteria bacterium]